MKGSLDMCHVVWGSMQSPRRLIDVACATRGTEDLRHLEAGEVCTVKIPSGKRHVQQQKFVASRKYIV
jgi:hypothetical protein